jgi:hypothetical protein
MNDFLGGLGTAFSSVVNFSSSLVRNTLVTVSNILPDGGLIGGLGDAIGNTVRIGGGTPFSGGASGGSFITPFTSQARSSDHTLFSNVDFFEGWFKPAAAAQPGEANTVKLESAQATQAPATQESPLVADTPVPGAGGADEMQLDLGGAAGQAAPPPVQTTQVRWKAAPVPSSLGPQEAGRNLVDQWHQMEMQTAGMALDSSKRTELNQLQSGLRSTVRQVEGALESGGVVSETQIRDLNVGVIAASTALNSPSLEVAQASFNLSRAQMDSKKLQPFSTSIKTRPEYQSFNAEVSELTAEMESISDQIVQENGVYVIPQQLRPQVESLAARANDLKSRQAQLEGGTYTQGFTRYDARGNSLGADAANIAVWAQVLTPFALAGLQYSWQSKIDKKNRRYLDAKEERERQHQMDMLQMRIGASGGGGSAGPAGPAAVGPSQSHSFSAGTSAR